MFSTDQAPGVYHQTVDAGSPPVSPLRTDICAIVGIAERGPVDVPVPVESWQQYISWFGGCIASGFLGYAVRGFFENGGRRCWVVRVASDDPLTGSAPSSTLLREPTPGGVLLGRPVWRVRASSHGVWGDRLSLVVREQNLGQQHTLAHDPNGRWSQVASQNGFSPGTLVRASQPSSPLGSPPVNRLGVVAAADPTTNRLNWVHPEPAERTVYDAPVLGFDPDQPILLQSVAYRMLVSEAGRLVRTYEGLSLIPGHARYAPTLLGPSRLPIDPITGALGLASPEPVVVEELRLALTELTTLTVDPFISLVLSGGRDGLSALTAYDFVGEPFGIDDSAEMLALKRRGLRAVEEISQIGLLAVPDIQVRAIELHPSAPRPDCVPDPCLDPVAVVAEPLLDVRPEEPPTFTTADLFRVQTEMVMQCERTRDRFAVLDAPYDTSFDTTSGIRGVLDWRARFDTSFAELCYPWLRVSDPVAGSGTVRVIPPSGHIAGLTAGTDLALGVHHAPANRSVEWALAGSVDVSDEQHAVLNSAGINVARTIGGRGLRQLGARTLSSDPDWRFVNARRLMAMIEKALGIALQWAVFEPNGIMTRARALMSVTFFLDGMHEAGMLAGRVPEESFFVRCDLENNPQETRDVGQLLVEVGVAPAQPFEFVVVRVGRVTDSIEVRSLAGSLGLTGTGV